MARILVFGDSISHGKWDRERGGWVQRLGNFLDEKSLSNPNFDYTVYNLSISGDTTKGLLKRFGFETRQRLEENKKPIIIFAIGTNDSYFVKSKNSVEVLPDKFKENVQKLINLAQKFSSEIIFIGLTPVEEPKVNPMPWDIDKSYNNESIKKYNEIIKEVCNKNNIYFVEIFEKLIETKYQELLEDGAHPNSEGHQKIYEIVRDFLIKNKII